MIVNLSQQHSLISNWISEIRDVSIQNDRMRFRRNLERIGEVAAYEISKVLPFIEVEVETPLGIATSKRMSTQPVIATILRAGLPLHQGILNYFDKADNAFISAYRKHNKDGSFDISLDYISCPELEDRVLIISDPMLATGSSLVKTIHFLKEEGKPKEIHIVAAIACTVWY
ncbi:MAG: uracil phosphoribosyltransferase [Bacteroidota bacterium]